MAHRIEIYTRDNNGEAVDVIDVIYVCSEWCHRSHCEDIGLPAPGTSPSDSPDDNHDLDLRMVRERVERETIIAALARANGNVLRAAEFLGVSRPTLYDLMNRLAVK